MAFVSHRSPQSPKKTRVDRRSAQRALSRLIEDRFVSVVGNESGGAPGATRRYRIEVAALTVDKNVTGDKNDSRETVDKNVAKRVTNLSTNTSYIRQSGGEQRGKPKKKCERRAALSSCPDDFNVSESMAAWAVGKGLSEDRVMPESEKFLDHHRSKGSRFVDWPEAWRIWIVKAVEFRARA